MPLSKASRSGPFVQQASAPADAMAAAGHVRIDLVYAAEAVREVAVTLGRPDTSRVLRGLTAGQAVAAVARLYSVCGCAQQVAAQRALESARGIAPTTVEEAEREDRVLRECAQEHLWRLLLDWPTQLGLAPAERTFVTWHRQLAQRSTDLDGLDAAASRFVREELLGMSGASWRALDGDGFERWLGAGGGLAPELLARLPPEPHTLRGADETSALVRQQHHPALQWALRRYGWTTFARVLARVAELVDYLTQIKSIGATPFKNGPGGVIQLAPQWGQGSVETARGRLQHEARLDADDRVQSYRVVAPTDVNFRADGPCARALTRLRASSLEAAVTQANSIVLGFDPCVPWKVSARPA
jgi:hypothetical protein